ncbi:hypothetical protein ACSV5K_16690 [Agrobacterium pusense]|uniref:hypothetical protein n=1 Tax=Agrobacterium pusense TaxID=648995 RepID=UPI003FD03AF9
MNFLVSGFTRILMASPRQPFWNLRKKRATAWKNTRLPSQRRWSERGIHRLKHLLRHLCPLSIDGETIGDGKISCVSSRLYEIYLEKAVGNNI